MHNDHSQLQRPKRTMVLLTYKTTEILYLQCFPKYWFDTINSVKHKGQLTTYLIRIYLYTRFLSICRCFYLFTHCISTLPCNLPNCLKTFQLNTAPQRHYLETLQAGALSSRCLRLGTQHDLTVREIHEMVFSIESFRELDQTPIT